MNTQTNPNLSRRTMLKGMGATGVLGVSRALFPSWMPRLAFRPQRQSAPGDVMIVVFLRGGMDSLNVVVPFSEGGNYYDRRPNIAIPEASLLKLNDQFGFHPSMRGLKEVYDAGQLAIITATGSPNPTRSHFDAMEFIERGTPFDKSTASGWVNRHLQSSAWQNESPFRAVGMGTMVQSSLRGPVSALALKSIADFHLEGREDQLAMMQQTLASLYTSQATSEMLASQAKEVFNTVDLLTKLAAEEYSPASGVTYPDSEFGYGLRQIAQLIKQNVGLEVACVDIGGWDTHDYQGSTDGDFSNNLWDLSNSLASFYADLQDYMGNITVITISEFGRTTSENASQGTDHGRAGCMFVMGGGVNGGVHGKFPGLQAENLEDGDLAVTTDYRDVISEILVNRVMNVAIDQIFPSYNLNLPGVVKAR
jgi:uncharacterized protein (DUF1501 family)